jgi:hypothetical protein
MTSDIRRSKSGTSEGREKLRLVVSVPDVADTFVMFSTEPSGICLARPDLEDIERVRAISYPGQRTLDRCPADMRVGIRISDGRGIEPPEHAHVQSASLFPE